MVTTTTTRATRYHNYKLYPKLWSYSAADTAAAITAATTTTTTAKKSKVRLYYSVL